MGDVMGDISHLQKEGVSLRVKHQEQGLMRWNSRLSKWLWGEEERFSEGPSELGKQSHGHRLWCRWKGLGHSSAASKPQPSLAVLPCTVSFACFPSAALTHWPGHAVVCSEHTEWSLCPKKMLVLKRPGRYRTVSQKWRGLWRQYRRWQGERWGHLEERMWSHSSSPIGTLVWNSECEEFPLTAVGIYADEKPWGGCSRAVALRLPDAATL